MWTALLGTVLLGAGCCTAGAQGFVASKEFSAESGGLPDAPGVSVGLAAAGSAGEAGALSVVAMGEQTPNEPKVAGPYDKYILPGQAAPKINAHDKFVLGVRDAISPFSISGWVLGAGYEQLVNGSPNYGQTGKGFAQRLGAGAVRDITEGVLGDSILAPLLHEDPRYYKKGKGHPFLSRLVYSGTRALITRTDGGKHTINLAQLGGNLGGSVLTNAYYPQLNRGFTQTAETFGGSVGGSALGFVVSEFLSDTLAAVHLKRTE